MIKSTIKPLCSYEHSGFCLWKYLNIKAILCPVNGIQIYILPYFFIFFFASYNTVMKIPLKKGKTYFLGDECFERSNIFGYNIVTRVFRAYKIIVTKRQNHMYMVGHNYIVVNRKVLYF